MTNEGTSLVAQTVKHLLTMRETWVRSLGQEDPLEKGMATHSSIHAWKIPWTKEPGGLQSMGSQRVADTGSNGKESAWNAGDLGSIPGLGRSSGGGHGIPLQYSCLENPHGQRLLAGYSPTGSQSLARLSE